MDYEKTLEAVKLMVEHGQISQETAERYFPELKEIKNERIRKAIHIYLDWLDGRKGYAPKGEYSIKDMIAWLEKQDEQKSDSFCREHCKGFQDTGKCFADGDCKAKREAESIDKVEPKFRVGDWIIQENIGVYKVIEVCESWYEVVDNKDKHYSIGFDKEYMCRLWTIQDARDGDVLYCESSGIEFIVMSKGVNIYGNIDSYFRYNSLNGFGVDIPYVLSARQDDITPATKEQRDLLFQKMKEAGYEWDDDKKELKKIEESKLTEFEDAIKDMMDDYRDAIDDNDATVEEVKEKAAYLLSLIPCKPADWSEEDERMSRIIGNAITVDRASEYLGSKGIQVIDAHVWLGELKDRVQPQNTWKPSDEQMKALNAINVIGEISYAGQGYELINLYEQLKKLREE